MNDQELQSWVEHISLRDFGRPFLHQATFNARLRTTGGRYFTSTHHIEINPHQLSANGANEVEKIIKHELCHYHLHLLNKGYRHRDSDFRNLLAQVGGSRFCHSIPKLKRKESYKYKLKCTGCGMTYLRKRKVNLRKYGCGKCRSKLQVMNLDSPH